MSIDFSIHSMKSNSTPAPYVVSASSEWSTSYAYRAFDNKLDWYWLTNATSTGWLKIDLGNTGIIWTLENYSITVNTVPEPNRAPKDWTIQGSNDNVNWNILDTVTSQTSWGSGETRNFDCDTKGGYYRYFKIDITANNGDSYLQIAELYLYGSSSNTPFNYLKNRGRSRLDLTGYSLKTKSGNSIEGELEDFAPHNMTAYNVPTPYVASASTEYGTQPAWKAFDGTTSYWLSNLEISCWLKIDMGSGSQCQLDNYSIRVNTIPEPNRAPKDWTIQGSNDDSTWDILDRRRGETSWGSGETRNFICSLRMGYYRYFKIDITMNNGDLSYTQIGELYLYGMNSYPLTSYLKNKNRNRIDFNDYSLRV